MVNEASRIESKSKGGDIVCSKVIIEDPGVKSNLSTSELTPEPFTAQLRGLIEERTLYRVQILKQVQL